MKQNTDIITSCFLVTGFENSRFIREMYEREYKTMLQHLKEQICDVYTYGVS
jgi:hypothetical protein